MLVLIVEDDPLVAFDLEDIVVENTAAEVIIGSTVKSSLRLLEQPVDFCLCDVDVADGKTHWLASALQERQVPFCFVSGSRREELPKSLQAVPFIAKPFAPSDILEALRRASLGRAAEERCAA